LNVFHDFEMKGLVSVVTYNLADGKSLIEAHKKLKEQVRDVGATHIFKIEYFDYIHGMKHSCYGKGYKIMGTAYGPKKKKNKLLLFFIRI